MRRMSEPFPDDLRAAMESLSGAAGRLLDHIEADPSLCDRSRFEPMFDRAREILPVALGFDPDGPYGVQPWPILVSESRREEMLALSRRLSRLVRDLPRRVFGDDVEALQAFYGLHNPMLAMLLMSEPTGIPEMVCRLDLVDTPDGIKCIEFNAGNPGGWQHNALFQTFQDASPLADFMQPLDLWWDDSVDLLIDHMVRRVLADPQLGGEPSLNLAVVSANSHGYIPANHAPAYYQARLDDALARHAGGRAGRIHVVTSPELGFDKGKVVVAGDRIHGVVEMVAEPSSRELFRSSKAGHVLLFTPPVGPLVLGDKRNLTLLSERADSELFSDDEREMIHRYIPWTRTIAADRVASFRGGPEQDMRDLVAEHRDELVLKGGLSVGGEHVVIGRFVDDARWKWAVDTAFEKGSWVMQEFLDVPLFPLQHGENGWAPHRLVWGPFVFGEVDGGLFVRVLPTEEGPVVNIGTGAMAALPYVVPGA